MSGESELHGILSDIARLVQAAYDRGFQDGSLAMRESILTAASAPMTVRQGAVSFSELHTAAVEGAGAETIAQAAVRRKAPNRAPRGAVTAALNQALSACPGSSVAEVEGWMAQHRPEIARKSIGNELRRMEGKLYERADKYTWFLKGDPRREAAAAPRNDAAADIFNLETERG